MQKVRLGNTNQEFSCIGLGTMYFGSKVDEQTTFDILSYYVAMGGNLLDSANKYASWVSGFEGGESERTIGKWMKHSGNRHKMFITSKVGFAYEAIPRSLKREIIITECEKSLQRLGIETIDLYFAHAFDAHTPLEESMEAFYQLKKSGKIRYAGASNFYGWQLAEANSIASSEGWEGFSCLQQRHTYLEPALRADFGTQLVLTPEIQEYCKVKNITIMAYSPLLGGAYVRNEKTIPVHYQNKINDLRIIALNEVARELGVSANAVVLAWMMQNLPFVVPIVAGSTVSQLHENLAANSFRLTEEQLIRLNPEINQPLKYS